MKKFGLMDIVLIIVFLLFVYFVLTRIFGHSATDFTIFITLFVFLGGWIYNSNNNVMNYVIKLNREMGEIKSDIKNSFDKVKQDMGEIKNLIKKR